MWTLPDNLSDPSNARADEAIAAASHILWGLSGRKYSGVKTITEFYDIRYFSSDEFLRAVPLMELNLITNGRSGCCVQCGYPHRMRLRGQPVVRIVGVEINGRAVDPAEYALIDHSVLGFKPGPACSAVCAKVTYAFGAPPPAGARAAAAKLADQLLLAWGNDDNCRLPERVTSISRQGVSWTVLDPQDFLNDGRTGIYEIDLFLKTANPAHALVRPRVFSPDLPRAQTIASDAEIPTVSVMENDLGVIAPGEVAWYVVPASQVTGTDSPVATVPAAGLTFEPERFTKHSDGSWSLGLTSAETWNLADGMTFLVFARPVAGPDVQISSGEVRFLYSD